MARLSELEYLKENNKVIQWWLTGL